VLPRVRWVGGADDCGTMGVEERVGVKDRIG
jgi:hypothetical protein